MRPREFEAFAPLLLADDGGWFWMLMMGFAMLAALFSFVLLIVMAAYGKIWFQAYMSSADVSILSLLGMGFRQVPSRIIVTAKIMAAQSGLNIDSKPTIWPAVT
jgi:uncharacterized protein YqfA (UPF0365 family)